MELHISLARDLQTMFAVYARRIEDGGGYAVISKGHDPSEKTKSSDEQLVHQNGEKLVVEGRSFPLKVIEMRKEL
jgi:hypothetical protein